MIELKVEDYCHGCTEFEAETRKDFLTADGRIVAVECAVDEWERDAQKEAQE